jgi:alkylation response protein AidB-like acyl-CoA dehydrogenase
LIVKAPGVSNLTIVVSVGLTEEQKHIQSLALEFAQSELKPNMQSWDAKHHFPVDKLKKAAEIGFGGR